MAHPTLPLPHSSRPHLHVVGEEERPTYDGEPARAPGFTMIPDAVRALKDGYATAVYEAIARHANSQGEAWPSIATICEHTGWSKPHVIRTIARLEEAGLIQRERRFSNGMKSSTLYRIVANVRMSLSFTTMSTTETLDVNHRDIGGKPQRHKQEPGERDTEELLIPPAAGKPRRRPAAKTPIPDDFEPTPEMYEWAFQKHKLRLPQARLKTERFINWAKANDRRYADWNAAWRNFMEPKAWDSGNGTTHPNAGGGGWVG